MQWGVTIRVDAINVRPPILYKDPDNLRGPESCSPMEWAISGLFSVPSRIDVQTSSQKLINLNNTESGENLQIK